MTDPPDNICTGCGATVTQKLSCPKCISLGLPPSVFCSQECFKSKWAEHKVYHEVALQVIAQRGPTVGHVSLENGVTGFTQEKWNEDFHLAVTLFCSRFIGYNFTGKLRPWPQTARRSVPSTIAQPDYATSGYPVSEMRLKNSSRITPQTTEQVERIRKACRIGREALDLAHAMVKPGITTEAIDVAVHNFILSKGGYPSPLNYHDFPKSCCTSINEVICHGIPDLRPLEDGDIVNVDITVYIDGMHGDLNETFCCGEVDETGKALVKAAYDSMMEAIAQCRPGTLYRRIGDIIASVVEPRGFSVVRSYCGHGIGELFHTVPNVPHYKRNKAIGEMKPGHVFTIEPMINEGKWNDLTWPDNWTSVTEDGKRSAQFEHTILITPTGCELLTGRLSTSPPFEIEVPAESDYFKEY